ncbi:MAG TPA: hypothetical protein VIZ66_03515 [Sphingomicrobium sp.]
MTTKTIKLALAAVAYWSAVGLPTAAEARSPPPLRNPALLNIGFVCRWQPGCIRQQEREMQGALRYVKKTSLPAWKIQLCNRNSSRNGTRKDWVGFNNCIRNPALRPPPPKRKRRR